MDSIQLDHSAHRASGKRYPLCFLAHDIVTPMNVGSLFRIADALGVEKIYLTGRSAVPPNRSIRKTSRAAEKHVPFQIDKEAERVAGALKDAGYRIVSLEIASHSTALEDFRVAPDDRICLVLGSESAGVGRNLLAVSDAVIHIPMLGVNSSMNVAAACAIATYVITKKLDDGRQKNPLE